MLSVHWRMAELWTLERQRGLTESEEAELSACLHYNAVYARKLAGLYNLSLAASMTRDTEWRMRFAVRSRGWRRWPTCPIKRGRPFACLG